MLWPEVCLLLYLLHYVQHLFIIRMVRHHLHTHRQPLWPQYLFLHVLGQHIVNVVREMGLILPDQTHRHDPSWILQDIPHCSIGNQVTEFLFRNRYTQILPWMVAGIGNPGVIQTSTSWSARYLYIIASLFFWFKYIFLIYSVAPIGLDKRSKLANLGCFFLINYK